MDDSFAGGRAWRIERRLGRSAQMGKGGDKLIPHFLTADEQRDHGKEMEEWRGKRFKTDAASLRPDRLGLRYPVEIGLTGDVKATLQELLPLLSRKTDRGFLQKAQRRMSDWNPL
jgi:hypothetical protein